MSQTKAKTIFRVVKNPENPFVMIDRRVIENPDLSWKAKGLLAYLLSRPDNWTVRFRDLVKRSPDGAHTVRVAMKELVKAGHVKVIAERENGRVKQWTYTVHEKPLSPDGEFQQVEIPQVENRTFSNTDSVSKNDSNGASAPKPPPKDFPADWQLAHDQEITTETEQDRFEKQARDVANMVDFQCAGGGELALAFMLTRNIHLPDESDNIKAHRKACREMLKQKVKGEHIKQAVRKLLDGNMTVTDLFSVQRTAIDLANPASQTERTPVTFDEKGIVKSW